MSTSKRNITRKIKLNSPPAETAPPPKPVENIETESDDEELAAVYEFALTLREKSKALAEIAEKELHEAKSRTEPKEEKAFKFYADKMIRGGSKESIDSIVIAERKAWETKSATDRETYLTDNRPKPRVKK